VILGANGDALLMALRALIPRRMDLNAIRNSEWQKQNGVSVLCAKGHVIAPFLLVMGDHLFDPQILERLVKESDRAQLSLAVDRKVDSIFDLVDATKVQTRGRRLAAIGKDLKTYDAVDTGVFLCPNEIFTYLHQVLDQGDCSLTDGVRAMARDGKVDAIDIGNAWWQDIDTPDMLRHAEEHLAARGPSFTAPAPVTAG
jgi:choline kinase